MSSLIGILSLLSALAATSYTLLCTYCISNETTCSGTMLSMTCYSGLQCASTYTETTIAGVESTSLTRSCALSSNCGLKGTVTLQHGQMRVSTSCENLALHAKLTTALLIFPHDQCQLQQPFEGAQQSPSVTSAASPQALTK
ncbi:uncharacterized protein LOC122924117 isoform X4 [Bufo gargarizans]|uniref:uncharacterized protein LOC122924117 isoform X4 n=1 Tax=Bufo gargarizans TaxID=30331 RepID=UPI001CF4EBE7|nr:uncharacterized protein LOC122924117 isoform X4 [Bufo gargarizans]